MKKIIFIFTSILFAASSCSDGSSNSSNNNGAQNNPSQNEQQETTNPEQPGSTEPETPHTNPEQPASIRIEDIVYETQDIPCDNYRKAMRDFVINISQTARKINPSFIVIPQNGQNVAWDDDDNPKPKADFFAAIKGCGREDAFYGMDENYDIADGKATPKNLSDEIQELCDVYVQNGLTVLSTDYTKDDKTIIEDSFSKNKSKGYISFAATSRNLDVIPQYEPYGKNSSDIKKLSDAKNFLYLINPDFSSKDEFINNVSQTDYDIVLIDLFYNEKELSSSDIQKLKTKKNGGKRLVICYMSIGEAEDYRWYWKDSWKTNAPLFMCEVNQDWEGNYKVKYWFPSWQSIICNASDSYLSKIVNAGFDGVYLDIIDAFEYFEEQSK